MVHVSNLKKVFPVFYIIVDLLKRSQDTYTIIEDIVINNFILFKPIILFYSDG